MKLPLSTIEIRNKIRNEINGFLKNKKIERDKTKENFSREKFPKKQIVEPYKILKIIEFKYSVEKNILDTLEFEKK